MAESTRLIWRDVHELDSVEDTLAGSSRIAEQALAVALEAVSGLVRSRHGEVRDAVGKPQSLVVFGRSSVAASRTFPRYRPIHAFAEHGGDGPTAD
jgi:glutamate-ammonia-ligase adenylyltransferase